MNRTIVIAFCVIGLLALPNSVADVPPAESEEEKPISALIATCNAIRDPDAKAACVAALAALIAACNGIWLPGPRLACAAMIL